jgi:hypothetical protein
MTMEVDLDQWAGKDLEGSGCGLYEASLLSWRSRTKTEGNHAKPQDNP